MYLFNRSISVNVRLVDEGTLKVEGFFLDSHHELCLSFEVDLESNTISSADGELRRIPHTDCALTQERIKKLIGINLNKNVRRQIQMSVGLKEGCTHLMDLAIECAKGSLQARYQFLHLSMREEELKNLVEQFLDGSCLHYNK